MSLFDEVITHNTELQEDRPYSRTQSAIDAAKGKVKGMFGSGQVEQGAQEVGAEANKYWNDFKRFVGRKYGKSQNSVPFQDVEQFFKGNGLDTKFLGNNPRRSFTPKDVGSALLQAVRQEMDDYKDQETTPRNQPQQQSQNQKDTQGSPDNAGSEETTSQETSNSGSLNNEIQSLSPAERSQLLTLLA